MAESVEGQETRAVLQIGGFINGYGPTIGLQQFDYILGVDGTPFLGTAKQFNALFAYEDEEDAAAHVDETWILTVKRDQTAFNISVTQSLGAKFDEVDADAHPLSENDLAMLRAATRSGLIDYMVFHDLQQNAELVDRSKALSHVFRLARSERDAWVGWPARVSAQMAADLEVDAHKMHVTLENYVREHLSELADIKPKVD